MEKTTPVAVLTDDLIFGSRIAAVARDHNAAVKTARNVEALAALMATTAPACVIVDLQVAGPQVADLVAAARVAPKAPRIVAYGSHVDARGLDRAIQVGCDIVLTRSQFVESLESDFAKWIAS
jgi:DNA-binding NarL/FixJ family response regulator